MKTNISNLTLTTMSYKRAVCFSFILKKFKNAYDFHVGHKLVI